MICKLAEDAGDVANASGVETDRERQAPGGGGGGMDESVAQTFRDLVRESKQ